MSKNNLLDWLRMMPTLIAARMQLVKLFFRPIQFFLKNLQFFSFPRRIVAAFEEVDFSTPNIPLNW